MAWARCNRKANSYIHRRLLRLLNVHVTHPHAHTLELRSSEDSSPWSPSPPEGSRVSSAQPDLRGRRWRSGWCGSSETHASCRTTRAPGASKAARCAGRKDGYSKTTEWRKCVNHTNLHILNLLFIMIKKLHWTPVCLCHSLVLKNMQLLFKRSIQLSCVSSHWTSLCASVLSFHVPVPCSC